MKILIDGQTLASPDIDRGIGRVFLGLCKNLILRNVAHEWLIVVPKGCDPAPLDQEVLRRCKIEEVPAIDLAGGYEKATSEYREALEKICARERVDLYWCPNPLMLNVVLPIGLSGPQVVCTIYDIIPARNPETYQADWTPQTRIEYESRLTAITGFADRLVFISDAAAHDFADWAPAAREKSTSISLGIEHARFRPSAALRHPPGSSFVLIVGGADPRKNVERSIEAFASICRERGEGGGELSLKIVGAYDRDARAALERVLEKQDMASKRVEFLGHVADATLARLYREAAVLLFPSLYEGFGLPVVEALASGTPVVVSDRAELREAAGPHGVFCDPLDVSDIAQKLENVLNRPWQADAARGAAIEWAGRFTWQAASDAYVSVFVEVANNDRQRVSIGQRPRVAWVSPWPPVRSGIATHSFELVRRLRDRLDIEIFTESTEGCVDTLGLPIRGIGELSESMGRFDTAIYHLGNNSDYHQEIYNAAWHDSGIAVLHDYNIHPFLHSAYLGTANESLYRDALGESHGQDGRRHFDRVKKQAAQPGIWDYPASLAIVRRSVQAVVHSAWVRAELKQAGATNVSVIPLGAEVRPRSSLGASGMNGRSAVDTRIRESVSSDTFVVGVFGFLNRQKRIPSAIAACKRLHDAGYPISLLIVGEPADDQLDLDAEIDRVGARGFTHVAGYVDDEAYWAYLDLTDVVLNLRFPSMGESSASLMRALGSGAPCIVSDYAQFSELPDSVCWKISTDDSEVEELTTCLAELLRDPELRGALGRNGSEYVASLSSFDHAASLYGEVVVAALSG